MKRILFIFLMLLGTLFCGETYAGSNRTEIMKKVIPLGFKYGSGKGWKYV